MLVEESKLWLWRKFANFISCLFLCLHYSKRIYVLKYTVPRSDSSLGSILSQHIIIPEVKVLFVEFRSFFLTFPHFYWRILSRQMFTGTGIVPWTVMVPSATDQVCNSSRRGEMQLETSLLAGCCWSWELGLKLINLRMSYNPLLSYCRVQDDVRGKVNLTFPVALV